MKENNARSRMTYMACVLLPLTGLLGCGPPPGTEPFYRPGRKLVLTYKSEFIMNSPDDGEQRVLAELKLPISVRRAAEPNQVELHVTIRRLTGGGRWSDGDGRVHRETETLDATDEGGREDEELSPAGMRRFRLAVVVNRRNEALLWWGDRTELEVRGKHFDTEHRGTPRYKLRSRAIWATYLSIIEDSLVYLPTHPVREGQTWKVHRPMIGPLQSYAFGMATGAIVVSEDAVCRLDKVWPTLNGLVAEISIKGERQYIPGFWLKQRMQSMISSGKMLVNLRTGEILRQRIETVCTFKPGEFPGKVIFIDELTLLAP